MFHVYKQTFRVITNKLYVYSVLCVRNQNKFIVKFKKYNDVSLSN